MPIIDTTIDIEVSSFLDECSSDDIKDIVAHLESEEGYIILNVGNNISLVEKEFVKYLIKIYKNRLRLTNEEEEFIKQIANKF